MYTVKPLIKKKRTNLNIKWKEKKSKYKCIDRIEGACKSNRICKLKIFLFSFIYVWFLTKSIQAHTINLINYMYTGLKVFDLEQQRNLQINSTSALLFASFALPFSVIQLKRFYRRACAPYYQTLSQIN